MKLQINPKGVIMEEKELFKNSYFPGSFLIFDF